MPIAFLESLDVEDSRRIDTSCLMSCEVFHQLAELISKHHYLHTDVKQPIYVELLDSVQVFEGRIQMQL